MKLTGEDARAVVYGDHDDWESAEEPTTDGHTRWAVQYSGVFLHKPSGKHYMFCWQRGATEMQDEQPFEYEKEVEPVEVEKKEIVRHEWVAKKV